MTSNVNIENPENACVVCFKNVDIYSIGDCDHPVCYECSTRMRVLCRQNECPICRQDMPKVIFTREVQLFRNIKNYSYLMDKKFKICFDNASIQSAYSHLLEHVCNICSGRLAFRTFQNLKDHMRKEHELYYCDLCVDNLKIFTGERRCYNRQELALHRRKGDPDDRSHRGHPLCEFCDQRYMDNDELFRHLRRDHLFCHFCDADGYHRYYSSYDYLRDHFRSEHYLCEEGNCAEEKFTSVFRTEIDLKAHRASVHGRTIGKAATKQARMLELEFTLAPRPRDRVDGIRNRRGGGKQRGRLDEEDSAGAVGGGDYDDQQYDTTTVFRNAPNINTNCIEEFPTLNGEAPPSFLGTSSTRQNSRKVSVNNNGGLTIRTVHQAQPLAVTDENFPALGPEGVGGSCKTVRLSVNSGGQDRSSSRTGTQKAPTNVSIHVNHRPSGSSQNIRIRPSSLFQEEFPSLGASKVTNPSSSVQWLSNQGSLGAKTKVSSSQSQISKTFDTDDFPTLSSKFSSGCSVTNADSSDSKTDNRSKKASSVLIPVTSSWTMSESSSEVTRVNPMESNFVSNISCDTTSVSGIGTIKAKSKKKKTKNPSHTTIRESSSSESGKKKKKHGNVVPEEQLKIQNSVLSKENNTDINENNKSQKCNTSDNTPLLERKRSELVIDSLITDDIEVNDNNESLLSANNRYIDNSNALFSSDLINDFPLVGSSNNWPPGFEIPAVRGKLTSAPPPGFGGGNSTNNSTNITAPPPGFLVTLNSIARPQSNGLTFTNSSGQSYSIKPEKKGDNLHSYVPPQDFTHRNHALVTRVKKVLDDQRSMDEFCQISKMFRQGEIGASDFYTHCEDIMGSKNFAGIFIELLVLLPDIGKQQELWAVHTENGKSTKDFEVCATCQQILSTADLRHHVSNHSLENHFPALGSSESMSSWGKK